MDFRTLHSWDISLEEAAELQRTLAAQVDVRTPLLRCDLLAGADVSYDKESSTVFAGVVVIRVADGSIVEKQGAVWETNFPYVPGFFSFREAPALLQAIARLQTEPD